MRHLVFGLALLGVFCFFLLYSMVGALAASFVSAAFDGEQVVLYVTLVVAMAPYMYCCVRLTGVAARRWRQ